MSIHHDNTIPDDEDWTFEGFSSPNYTQVPDELFDELLADLSGAEVKVLLYIIRRTFGFKKNSDTISLTQMMTGLRTRDGRILDRGVGLSKKTLLKAIASLEAHRIILTERRRSAERGDEPTSYRLNVVSQPPGGKSTPPQGEKVYRGGGGETPPPPWGRNSPTQETDLQETDEQETDGDTSNIRMASPWNRSESGQPLLSRDTRRSTAPSATPESIGEVLDRQPRRSSVPRRSVPRPETETEGWQAIQNYVIDFARLLGDSAPTKSSTTRAHNLFLNSGLPLEAFLDKMYQARALTQERSASITKTAEDPTYHMHRKTKMAYFFAVLEDQLKPESQRTRKPESWNAGTPDGRKETHRGSTTQEERPGIDPAEAENNTAAQAQVRRQTRSRDSDGPYGPWIER